MKVLSALAITLVFGTILELLSPFILDGHASPSIDEPAPIVTAEDVTTMVQCSAYALMLAKWAESEGREGDDYYEVASDHLQVALFFTPTITENPSRFLGETAIAAKIKAENLYGKSGQIGMHDVFVDECNALDFMVQEHAIALNSVK